MKKMPGQQDIKIVTRSSELAIEVHMLATALLSTQSRSSSLSLALSDSDADTMNAYGRIYPSESSLSRSTPMPRTKKE